MDPGQNGAELDVGVCLDQVGHLVGMGGDHIAGQPDQGRAQIQSGLGDLLPGPEGQGPTHGAIVFHFFGGRKGQDPALRHSGAGSVQTGQGLPAEGVQGGHGDGQTIVQVHSHGVHMVDRAACLGQLAFDLFGGHRPVSGSLGGRSLDGGLVAGLVPDGETQGLTSLHRGRHPDRGELVLPPGVVLAGLFKELGGVLDALGAHTKHIRALLVPVVALGESLTGEGGLQLGKLFPGGFPAFPHGGGIDARDDGDVLRPLHAAFDLQASHPHVLQILKLPGQGHVLQGEGVAGLLVPRPAEGQTAGLGAQAPVAAAAPQDGGQEALAAVAHAQGPVDKGLQLHGRGLAQGLDGGLGQLPGEDHPGHAQVSAGLHAVQVVDGHLGGGVDVHIGDGLPEKSGHAQVLDQDGVDADLRGKGGGLRRQGQFSVGQEGVQGQVDLGPPLMAVGNGLAQLLLGEVLGVAPGVEGAVAQIDGIRPGLDRCGQRLGGTGRCEKFHGVSPSRSVIFFGLLGLFGGLLGQALELGEFPGQPGVLVQGLLQLGPEIVGDGPLLLELISHVQTGQNGTFADGEEGALHGGLHLLVQDGGALLDVALILFRQDAVGLVVDANRHTVCHIEYLLVRVEFC